MKCFALTVILLAQGVWGQSGLCVPDCSAASEGDTVPDPTSCLCYYHCSDPDGGGILYPSDAPACCPDGEYFNHAPSVMDCDVIVPGSEYCTGLCSPCDVACELPGTLIPHPRDCNLYYVCLTAPDDVLLNSCPADMPYFDYDLGVCSSDPQFCYDFCDPCETYCATEGKIPNPEDCLGYYYCDPPYLSPFTCPEGEYFNVDHLICEDLNAPNCTSLC